MIFLAFLVLFLAIQFVPVERTNPPVISDFRGPEEVKKILVRSCYDCHSNETKWPWYAKLAPGSWILAHDVSEGRFALNFSEWDDYEADEQVDLVDLVGSQFGVAVQTVSLLVVGQLVVGHRRTDSAVGESDIVPGQRNLRQKPAALRVTDES